MFGAVRMVFSCFVVALQGRDAAWRGRFAGACKHELERASRRESLSGEGSTSHPARKTKVDRLPRAPSQHVNDDLNGNDS